MPGYKVQRASRHMRGKANRDRYSILEQLRRHSVALISLAVAISSLGYNTWRNETSELQRNWRQAAFQTLAELNQMQQIVLYRRYFHGREEHLLTPLQDAQTWLTGWGKAATIRDLTLVLPAPLPEHGENLHTVWQHNAAALDADPKIAREAEQALLEAIDEARVAVVALIDRLR